MSDSSSNSQGIYALSNEERFDLAAALMQRPHRTADGRAAIRDAFPNAPDEMVGTAAFHLYTDGVEAAVDFIAAAEHMIREPSQALDYGTSFHLAYHLYNWMQFRALLPAGQQEVLDLVKQVREALDDNDVEFANKTLMQLESLLGGTQRAPQVE